ncbi:MAG: hypothetical protein K1W23_00640 [Lachnospiraceae bacterium]
MAGKNVPKVSFNGIEKNHWIEGKDSYMRMYNDPSSTHINYEMLTLRGKSSKEPSLVSPPTETDKPVDFVKLGKVKLKLK